MAAGGEAWLGLGARAVAVTFTLCSGLRTVNCISCPGTSLLLQVLKDWEAKFEDKYHVVGRVVPPLELTPAQLRQHDGRDLGKPLLLAIKGTVFDVTSGASGLRGGGVAATGVAALLEARPPQLPPGADALPCAAHRWPGSDYYGPDGVYPFAGHECARALAKFSTEESGEEGLGQETCRDESGCTCWPAASRCYNKSLLHRC